MRIPMITTTQQILRQEEYLNHSHMIWSWRSVTNGRYTTLSLSQ